MSQDVAHPRNWTPLWIREARVHGQHVLHGGRRVGSACCRGTGSVTIITHNSLRTSINSNSSPIPTLVMIGTRSITLDLIQVAQHTLHEGAIKQGFPHFAGLCTALVSGKVSRYVKSTLKQVV